MFEFSKTEKAVFWFFAALGLLIGIAGAIEISQWLWWFLGSVYKAVNK